MTEKWNTGKTGMVNAVVVQTTHRDGKHPAYYAEARYPGGKFAHQTRNRRTPLNAKIEMNNWCRKNKYFPQWRNI